LPGARADAALPDPAAPDDAARDALLGRDAFLAPFDHAAHGMVVGIAKRRRWLRSAAADGVGPGTAAAVADGGQHEQAVVFLHPLAEGLRRGGDDLGRELVDLLVES